MVTGPRLRDGDRRAKLRVSQLTLMRVILGFRLLFLVLLPLQEGLVDGLAGHEALLEGLAAAVLYTIVLAVYSRRILAAHLKSWAFTAVDISVVFVIYFATGSGSSWPFFLFASTTVLFAGLRGRVGGALVTTVVWNVMTSLAWVAKGVPVGRAFGISSFDDLFNLSLVAAIWAYSIGLIARLNTAEEELNARREELARANAALDGQEKEIVGLLDIGNAISSRVDLPGIVQVARHALDGMGFGRNRLWVLDGAVLRILREDAPRSIPADGAGPLETSVRERAVTSVRPGSEGVAPDALPGVEAGTLAIIVPVVSGTETFGAVVVESRSGQPFSAEDTDLLAMFAEVMALALRHARFFERARDQAVADERHRLSVQMQGTVIEEVSSSIDAADELMSRATAEEARRKMRLVGESLRAGMQDLRVAVLNWDSLDWVGSTAETAERYVEQWSELSGIGVDWDVRGQECGVDASASQDILRILQEALSNAWRHGEAERVSVRLGFEPDGVGLSVSDDGTGFDPDAVAKGTGVGLRGIRARAERNRGRADVTSAPGEGTTIDVWMPCGGEAT